MSALTEAQHSDIAELLPDYVVGALGDAALDLVEAHLETCPQCQAEFDHLLDVVSIVAPVTPPSLATRRALLDRTGQPRPAPVSPPLPIQPLRLDVGNQPRQLPRAPARLAWIALSAAAVALLALGGWSLWQQQEIDEQESLIALFSEPANAHPLTDSEVQSDASAVLYVDPGRDQALLTAQDLPSLADGQRYQVWLFTEAGQRIGAGTFAPEPGGNAVVTVDAPESFETYWAVAISAEPVGGSEAPTSPLLLGGWIQ